MAYRYFRLTLAAHVLAICITSLVIAHVATSTTYYATLTVLVTVLVLQILALARYVERTNRELGRFLAAVRYADFSQSFSAGGLGGDGAPVDGSAGSFTELAAAFDDILRRFREARTEKEEQASYLNTLVQHIPIAVLAFDGNGRIDLFNSAARRLLDTPGLRDIRGYRGFGADFPQRLLELTPGRAELMEVVRDEAALELSVAATELRTSGRILKIVTLQDIRRELEARELAAWRNLIRVLTHEIMNSVTPISSLAGTAAELLGDVSRRPQCAEGALADARDAVQTIATRSAGLLRFADSYRRLTRVPAPVPRTFDVNTLFSRVGQLMEAELASRQIRFVTALTPPGLKLMADPDLVEQVLLNLLKNAIDAVADTAPAEIGLTAEQSGAGQVLITVSDNGSGMSAEVRQNLFVPFYTTKRHGTGVGLSLVQQIMRAHHGSVSVQSAADHGTAVRLRF